MLEYVLKVMFNVKFIVFITFLNLQSKFSWNLTLEFTFFYLYLYFYNSKSYLRYKLKDNILYYNLSKIN